MAEPEVERTFVTRRFLDKSRDPWEYVEEVLPTQTKRIFSRNHQGTILCGSFQGGSVKMGSLHFSGSHYDFGPGSYALRIFRRSVALGSIHGNASFVWKLWHSREGTIDMIPFHKGSLPSENRVENIARPDAPIYAFGPGTIIPYFECVTGSARVYSSLEGIF